MQRQGSIPQLCGRNPGHPDVDGHRLHVEAVAGDAMSVSAEEFVAPRRAETADHINFKIGIPERSSQVVEQVEYSGIVLMNFAGAVVAQIMVQARQRFLIVAFAVAVDGRSSALQYGCETDAGDMDCLKRPPVSVRRRGRPSRQQRSASGQ